MMPPPLSPVGLFAIRESRLLFGWTANYRITSYDAASGAEEPFLSRVDRGREVTADLVESWKSELMERAPTAFRVEWQRYVDEAQFPALVPAFDQMVVDGDSRIWIRDYAPPGNDHALWSIFDTSGAWQFDVSAPQWLKIHLIDGSTLWGVWQDDLDVEHVGAFELNVPSN